MKIQLFYDNVKFRYEGWRKIWALIKEIILSQNKIPDDISVIITGDEELLQINKEFLGHDYYTDVITFDNSKGDFVAGEIYISADRIKVNAIDFGVSKQIEMRRVIIHGILHLIGMDDKSDDERLEMRGEEDKWLFKLSDKD